MLPYCSIVSRPYRNNCYITCSKRHANTTPPRPHRCMHIHHIQILILGLMFICNPVTQPMDSSSCLTGILVVCVSRYFWSVLIALGTALLKICSLGEEEKVKTVLKSWIAFSLSVVAPRTPPRAPPPLEFTDVPLSKNYASVASISTNLSLNRLTFCTPEDCLRLNSFANFQAWLVQLFLRIRWGEEKYLCCLAQNQTFPCFPRMKHSFGTQTWVQRAEICTGPVTWGKDRIEVKD